MILEMVAVFDDAASAFMRPFFVASKGMAVRSFRDEVNRASDDNVMYKHPEHFALYYLGQFDDGVGHFKLVEVAQLLNRASDVKENGNA